MALLIFYAALAICVSFLCSLLEAGLLSLPRSHVQTMVENKAWAGPTLQEMKTNIDRPLSAILTLNTVAHTVGAAGVGAQAAVVWNDAAVGIASAIMTLAILIFSEIIPKTLGATHAKRLASFTAITTKLMIWLCLPLILILEQFNRLIGYERHQDRISRSEVLATVRLGREGGTLREREHQVVANVLALTNIPVSKVLTPRTVVFSLSQDMTVDQVIEQYYPLRFARVPLYRDNSEHIMGYVARFDLHKAKAEGRGDAKLADIAKPILAFPEQASVADAFEQMLHDSAHIAQVVDEYGGMDGIITLEDLIETLLGEEIVDETDTAIDMQELAKRRAKRRETE